MEYPNIFLIDLVNRSSKNKNMQSESISNNMVARIYKNTYVFPIQVSGNYLNIYNNISESIDFMKIDSDFVYINDIIQIQDIEYYNQNFYNYFTNIMKIFHFHYNPMLFRNIDNILDKDKVNIFAYKFIDNILSLIKTDVIIMTEYLWDQVKYFLKKSFNDTFVNQLQKKVLFLPPAGFYRYENISEIKKDYSKIRFLWNHILSYPDKRYELFERIVKKYIEKYGNAEVYITYDKNDKVKLDNVIFTGQLKEKEYSDILHKTNFSIAVTKDESFGISLTDSIQHGHMMVGLNDGFYPIFYGDKYSYNIDNIVDGIYDVFTNKREENIVYHKNIVSKFINGKQWENILGERLNELLIDKYRAGCIKGGKLIDKILQLIDKKGIVSKYDIYAEIGFSKGNTDYWMQYYYGLRSRGVKITYINNCVYYFLDENNIGKLKQEGFF